MPKSLSFRSISTGTEAGAYAFERQRLRLDVGVVVAALHQNGQSAPSRHHRPWTNDNCETRLIPSRKASGASGRLPSSDRSGPSGKPPFHRYNRCN